jgi:hypothetical protein
MSWLWPHQATRPTSQRPGRADWLTSDKEAVMRVVALISWIVTALAGALLHLLPSRPEQADCRHDNPPPAPGSRPAICLRRLLLPA